MLLGDQIGGIVGGLRCKGIGLSLLTDQVLFLIAYDVVVLFFAARLFRQTLD